MQRYCSFRIVSEEESGGVYTGSHPLKEILSRGHFECGVFQKLGGIYI